MDREEAITDLRSAESLARSNAQAIALPSSHSAFAVSVALNGMRLLCSVDLRAPDWQTGWGDPDPAFDRYGFLLPSLRGMRAGLRAVVLVHVGGDGLTMPSEHALVDLVTTRTVSMSGTTVVEEAPSTAERLIWATE